MQHDEGADLSRLAIAEHHQIDELVEALRATGASSPAWLPLVRKLTHEVEHRLKEEHRFFQMAGKLLSEEKRTAQADAYVTEYASANAHWGRASRHPGAVNAPSQTGSDG